VSLFTSGGLGLGLKNMVLFTSLTLNYLFRFVTCIKDELLNIIYQSTHEITLIPEYKSYVRVDHKGAKLIGIKQMYRHTTLYIVNQ